MLPGPGAEVTDISDGPGAAGWTLGTRGASALAEKTEDFLGQFKIALSLRLRNPSDVRRGIARVRALVESDPENRITNQSIIEHLGKLSDAGRGIRTVKGHLSSIRQFCQWLVEAGYRDDNPAATIRLRSAPDPMPIWLTDGQLDEALDVADCCGIWPEVALAAGTGLRMSELRALRWATVNLGDRTLVVRGKGDRIRQVPLGLLAREAFHQARVSSRGMSFVFPGWSHSTAQDRHLIERPRGEDWWKKTALKPLQDKLPIYKTIPVGRAGRGWHLFRHTFASHLVQAGVPIYKVAAWLGHSSVHTTRLYAHLSPGYDSDIELVGSGRRKGDGR